VKANTAFLHSLKEKLPEFFTADKFNDNGEVIEQGFFDWQKFKNNLEENSISTELTSGYQLDFIGKNYAKKQAGERPTTVIVPDKDHNEKEENKNSKNLFFTGDNLEVLRHLQSAYANSVDFIYIDPPYNTGSDGFVYPDKFEFGDEELKNMFGMNEEELQRLKSIQGKATHSAWLTFMYPRLYLAKKLLKDSGVIFVSIDDNEQANLKLLMDDVFGEGSFVDQIIWKGKGGGQDSTNFVPVYESIFVFAKNIASFELGVDYIEEDESDYRYFDEKFGLKYKRQLARKWGSNARREDRPNLYFPVIAPDGSEVYPHLPDGTDGSWRHNQLRLQLEIENGEFEFVKEKKTDEWILYQKMFASKDGKKSKKFTNLIDDISSGTGTTYVQKIFDGLKTFDYPKPVELIKRFIKMIDDDELIILDFFAGSGTTADAVMQLNQEDNGNRQYIMVQLPEPTKIDSPARKAGFSTIDEISRERIKRAAEKIGDNSGFKHFRMVEPTMKALEQINYEEDMQLDIFENMISLFSSEYIGVQGNADGFDTLLQTYMTGDNYKFDAKVEMREFDGIKLPYVNDTRIYIVAEHWKSSYTKALVNEIGTNQIKVQTIVVYGYTMDMESLRELEIALSQLETKVNLQVRY